MWINMTNKWNIDKCFEVSCLRLEIFLFQMNFHDLNESTEIVLFLTCHTVDTHWMRSNFIIHIFQLLGEWMDAVVKLMLFKFAVCSLQLCCLSHSMVRVFLLYTNFINESGAFAITVRRSIRWSQGFKPTWLQTFLIPIYHWFHMNHKHFYTAKF